MLSHDAKCGEDVFLGPMVPSNVVNNQNKRMPWYHDTVMQFFLNFQYIQTLTFPAPFFPVKVQYNAKTCVSGMKCILDPNFHTTE